MQELEGGTSYIGEVDDSDMKVKLKQKEQHIQTLQTQVESLQQHSNCQSRQILQLKQELEALKTSGEEIDTSWRNMVDQLEEENQKLSVDVGGFRRDNHFLERSIEALKARNAKMEPLVLKLQAQLAEIELQKEHTPKQLESMKESIRKSLKHHQLERENRQLSEQIKKLSSFEAGATTLIDNLKAEVRELGKEKETLQNEVQVVKIEGFMEDYLSQVGETAMDKRKVKPPGGAEKASGDEQQGGGAEQEESIVKDGTNRKLQQDVNQLQQRLKYAEQLEERNLKLTTEERKHEQEKQLMKAEIQQLQHKASVSRPYTRGYEHEQKLQEMVKRYEREYNEQLEENGRLQEKISQIEKGMCEDTVVTHIDDIGDSDLKVELKKKEQHIHALQTQVESLQQFSKGQSRQVLQLKQELEALKMTGEEVDTSYRIIVDQLEEENRKLLVNVNGLHQDKHYMEKSMEAVKARNIELEALVQAQLAEIELQEEDAKKQLESMKESSRKSLKRHQLERENRQLSEKIKKLSSFEADATTLINNLKAEIRELGKEKETLQNKVQVVKIEVETFAKETEEWRSACNAERCRREALDRRIAELEKVNDQLQRDSSYEFWNVPRSEVYLNMQKFLGTGAWGFVVEGTFRGQQVAVKCLHDMIRAPKFVEVMRKEITIMAQVQHPNLVLLIAAVVDAENDPLIVTELLDISLRKAYEKKRLQGSSKLSIFRDIAAALNYLHLRHCGEIIHRDVSSSNVLLEAKPNNQWKAKLSDFGSAKLAIEAKTTAPGAPVYSAPEVKKEMGIHQTAKIDVYSYGILLCEVTTEQFPDEESLPGMMKEVQDKWAFMHRLITSCVQDHPDRRPTMSYILSELNTV